MYKELNYVNWNKPHLYSTILRFIFICYNWSKSYYTLPNVVKFNEN